MYNADNHRLKKMWLLISVCINLGFLGVFKYYNFFIDSFADSLSLLGVKTNFWTINVILPVGISFYTFHGLSYVFDIFNNKIKPVRNFIEYSVFVSFFPLLVAGPIERATHLLPQIQKKRHFDYAYAAEGMRQILWGLFKKVVIADNCATYVNLIFNNSADYSGSTLVLGVIFFAFQIYCDFSGYSDIALGTARLFGIELLRNFAYPYFARDIAEFGEDAYFINHLVQGLPVYTFRRKPGRDLDENQEYLHHLFGEWFLHGANWTFIVWGALNALYFYP